MINAHRFGVRVWLKGTNREEGLVLANSNLNCSNRKVASFRETQRYVYPTPITHMPRVAALWNSLCEMCTYYTNCVWTMFLSNKTLHTGIQHPSRICAFWNQFCFINTHFSFPWIEKTGPSSSLYPHPWTLPPTQPPSHTPHPCCPTPQISCLRIPSRIPSWYMLI